MMMMMIMIQLVSLQLCKSHGPWTAGYLSPGCKLEQHQLLAREERDRLIEVNLHEIHCIKEILAPHGVDFQSWVPLR